MCIDDYAVFHIDIIEAIETMRENFFTASFESDAYNFNPTYMKFCGGLRMMLPKVCTNFELFLTEHKTRVDTDLAITLLVMTCQVLHEILTALV